MKARYLIVLALVTLFFLPGARADEGMWLPLLVKQLNIKAMQQKGFKLSAEDIYSVNRACLKDAVVIFGGGCTGGIVSPEGLLLTNHHCAYSNIQSLSSVSHDYLTHGYSASNRDEELPCKGLSVSFLEYMEDVTKVVLKDISTKVADSVRAKNVKLNTEKLIADLKAKDSSLNYEVEPLFYGNQYFLFAYKTYRDVRLVVAPPSAVGKFGGDTDNWMWPRHTGDFTLLRVYADSANQPAQYSPRNVPLRAKNYFHISTAGLAEDDFVMVFGYPGSTQRYVVSQAVEEVMAHSNPRKVALRSQRLATMGRYMETNDTIRIQYASKHASVANAWKKWQGEASGLRRLNAVERKRQQEDAFRAWVAKGPKARKALYGTLLDSMASLYKRTAPLTLAIDYYTNGLMGIEAFNFATRQKAFIQSQEQKSLSKDNVAKFKESGQSFFKDYAPRVDRDLMRGMLRAYITRVPEAQQLPTVVRLFPDAQAIDAFVDRVMAQSIFTSQSRFDAFCAGVENGTATTIDDDELYQAVSHLADEYRQLQREPYLKLQRALEPHYRHYVRGLMEMNPDSTCYPDANFTLRVAYGAVQGYEAREAVKYTPFTTLDGVMEKVAAGAHDYVVPERLRQLYETKDYGRWGVNGSVPTCVLASVHTTGGNSGSPALNAKGELIGLNFDRVWEGTMSDLMFDPQRCRNIVVDIRYVLFMIDKYAQADYLIKEMTLVK